MSRLIYYFCQFYEFIEDIIRCRNVIYQMAKHDFRNRYLGSQLGIIWAFIHPAITIVIFWFVFEVGFKSIPVDNFPFLLWLMAGIIPWFFFAESLASATNSVQENSFLVKKIVFRVSILPIIKILSALIIHLFFVFILLVMYIGYGYKPGLYALQIPYFLLSAIILILGLSWITSSLVVFFKDMGQIVSILIQFGFWLTPIFWSLKMIPEKYRIFLLLNPVYYITEGYRNSLIYGRWFWEEPYLTAYFWLGTMIMFCGGALLFRRLRPHFADVL